MMPISCFIHTVSKNLDPRVPYQSRDSQIIHFEREECAVLRDSFKRKICFVLGME